MTITIDQIKTLRKATKAGVMDARKALTTSKGDIEKAKTWLIKQGLTKAAKKADRETSEGLVETYVHTGNKVGAMVMLACETDFVAKTEELKDLAREVAMQVVSMNPSSLKELSEQPYIRDAKRTIGDLVKEAVAKLGENVQIKDFKRMEV